MKLKLLNITATLLLTFITILIIPKNYFNKYKIEKISQTKNTSGRRYFHNDLDNDGSTELIQYIYSNNLGNSINIKKKNVLIDLYNLEDGEQFISNNLYFADNNKNNINEICFISTKEKIAFLNILEFNQKKMIFTNKRIVLDSLSYYNNFPDAINHYFSSTEDNKIVFNLQAGFNIQPRNIYIYDLEEEKLIKTETSSMSIDYIKPIYNKNKNYILPCDIFASGNTISLKDLDLFSKSKNIDTIKLFEKYENKAYLYGDFSAYSILFDEELNFKFPPIEYKNWTKRSVSDYFIKNNQIHILSYITSLRDKSFIPILNLIDSNGKILRTIEFKNRISSFYINRKTEEILVFSSKNDMLWKYNYNLELKTEKKLKNIPKIIRYDDFNNDNTLEFLTLKENKVIIYSNNFKSKSEIDLQFCNNNFNDTKVLDIFKENNQTYFQIELGQKLFVLKYYKNPKYFLIYFVFILLFIAWYLLLWLILKVNSKRLEQDNLRLEKNIVERTIELANKNNTLSQQKDEIINQRDELKLMNEHLVELGSFKETIISTIIHDLKNPLNTIINLSENDRIIQSANSMLNLVLNILEVQKSKEKKVKPNFKNVLLNEIIKNAYTKVRFLLKSKNIKILETYNPNIEIKADKMLIIRVFENLLTNAIKFSELNETIEIKGKINTKNIVLIEVIDNGIGISKDKLNSIFDKYEQNEIKNIENESSTGLGLTFCKMAIEAHNGKIRADNNSIKGLKISFTILGQINKSKKIEHDFIENKISFTNKEILILKPIIIRLKEIPLYEISIILEEIKKIQKEKETENIIKWKNSIKAAIYSANKKLYFDLLNIT